MFLWAASAFARIENHYFINDGFMRDGQLLEKQEIDKMYAHSVDTTDVSETNILPLLFKPSHPMRCGSRPLRCSLPSTNSTSAQDPCTANTDEPFTRAGYDCLGLEEGSSVLGSHLSSSVY